MKTNFQAYQTVLNHYKNHQDEISRGIINDRERLLIGKEFSLPDKDLIQLQDARDFVVAMAAGETPAEGDTKEQAQEKIIIWDMMSAITFVIDCVKLSRGGEV